MIPLPVILVEFLLAFGAALFFAHATAIFRLRREQNWPPYRPAGTPAGDLQPLSRTESRERRVPSRGRLLTGVVIGLGVSLWAVASLLNPGSR